MLTENYWEVGQNLLGTFWGRLQPSKGLYRVHGGYGLDDAIMNQELQTGYKSNANITMSIRYRIITAISYQLKRFQTGMFMLRFL